MNWTGTRTLLKREIRRFIGMPGQTLAQPLISTALYFIIFSHTADRASALPGISYQAYIVPGLVFLGIAQNSYQNASGSLFLSKIQGSVVDLLVAPLGPGEFLIGFVGGAMVRGLIVGLVTWLASLPFTGLHPVDLPTTLFFALTSAWVFAVLGLLSGLWADRFEQVSVFPTFFILPLTLLGGVFYSVHALPEPLRTVSLANPVVYMVDGVRAGMLRTSDGSPLLGGALLGSLLVIATAVAYRALSIGYRLRK